MTKLNSVNLTKIAESAY